MIKVNGSDIVVKDGTLIKTTGEYTTVVEGDRFGLGLAALSELLLKAEDKVRELMELEDTGLLAQAESDIQSVVSDVQDVLDLWTGGDED